MNAAALVGDVRAVVRAVSAQARRPSPDLALALDALVRDVMALASAPPAPAPRAVKQRRAKGPEASCSCGQAARYLAPEAFGEVAMVPLCETCWRPSHRRPGAPVESQLSAAAASAYGERWEKGDARTGKARLAVYLATRAAPARIPRTYVESLDMEGEAQRARRLAAAERSAERTVQAAA